MVSSLGPHVAGYGAGCGQCFPREPSNQSRNGITLDSHKSPSCHFYTKSSKVQGMEVEGTHVYYGIVLLCIVYVELSRITQESPLQSSGRIYSNFPTCKVVQKTFLSIFARANAIILITVQFYTNRFVQLKLVWSDKADIK